MFALPQKVANIRFEQAGKKIHIYYDLQGDETYNVEVFCSMDDGQTWGEPLQKVTGAVGKNQKPENNKEIIWDVLAEREKLTGDVRFKIEAFKLVNIEMVFVQGGTFQMGCTSEQSDCDDNEKPEHTVTVDDFYIGKYEITQKQWRDVMGKNPNFLSGCDDCPVESESWNNIQLFLKKLNQKTGQNYRLPTEAEWEYAARGGSQSKGYKYSGSNNIDNVAWYWKNSGDKTLSGDWSWDEVYKNNCHTHPVGQKSPNELGIYDMSGNVLEWCNDKYNAHYYSISPANSPHGPSGGTERVLHGGAYGVNASNCRVSNRVKGNPDDTYDGVGFRIVRQ